MKVTIMTLEYPPNVYGGVGVHVKSLVEHLKKYVDIEIRTLAFGRKEKGVREYPSWEFFDGKYPWDKVLGAISLDLAIARDPDLGDIVHTHTWYMNLAGFLAKKLHNVKLVSTVHSLEPLRPWKREQISRGYELSVWMEKIGLENSDRIIAVSQGMKEDIMQVYNIPEERIEVIYNGIDTSLFRHVESREILEELGIEEPYVLFVGRLTRQKGIDTLVDASSKIKAKIVLVTGKEDSKDTLEYYRGMIEGKENIIWLHRYFPIKNLIQLYSHASVFVTPSIYEPFGIINLEAMACGTPVVASNVGGIREIVEDGINGFLVLPRNADKLAEKVNLLLEDDDLREQMGKNARMRAMKFSWENVAKKTYELYRKVLEDGGI